MKSQTLFSLDNCHGHFFAVTDTFLTIVTAFAKNVTGKKHWVLCSEMYVTRKQYIDKQQNKYVKYFQIVRPFCLVNFIKKYTYDRSFKKSVLYCSTMLNNSWNEILVKIYPYRRSFSKILGLLHEKNPKPAEIRRAFWWPVALDTKFRPKLIKI